MRPKNKKEPRPSWVYFLIGLFALFTIFKIGKRFYDYESSKLSSSEIAAMEEKRNEELHTAKWRFYAQGLNLDTYGVRILDFTNEPYPLFYISVSKEGMEDDGIIYVLERLLEDKAMREKIDLGGDWYSDYDSAPAEVKLVLDDDYDAVLFERLFLLKKSRYGDFLVEEDTTK